MTKNSIPRSYQPWCVFVPVIILEAITADAVEIVVGTRE